MATQKPKLEALINVYDFAHLAYKILPETAWNYILSGADNEITVKENENVFARISFRPRILIDVRSNNMQSNILGFPCSCPIYISTAGSARNAHPDGETALNQAAFNENIIQMVPSYSLDKITIGHNQCILVQLYIDLTDDKGKKSAEKMIRNAIMKGCHGLVITVDTPTSAKRARDKRPKTSFRRTRMKWNDLLWIKSLITKLTSLSSNVEPKLILKGIQCGEDVLNCIEYGVDAVMLSNHGGRQLDYARSSIQVLIEVMDILDKHNKRECIEVLVDGGFRRGTDVFKALALGAKGVGISRPVLYGLACYGQRGVEKVIQIFKQELKTTMQMMGCLTLGDINKTTVIHKNVGAHLTFAPRNSARDSVYTPLKTAAKLRSNL